MVKITGLRRGIGRHFASAEGRAQQLRCQREDASPSAAAADAGAVIVSEAIRSAMTPRLDGCDGEMERFLGSARTYLASLVHAG